MQALGDQAKVLTPITHHYKEDPEMLSQYPDVKDTVTFKTGPPEVESYLNE